MWGRPVTLVRQRSRSGLEQRRGGQVEQLAFEPGHVQVSSRNFLPDLDEKRGVETLPPLVEERKVCPDDGEAKNAGLAGQSGWFP